jgi:SagB-type dehydrogenase family enzyme
MREATIGHAADRPTPEALAAAAQDQGDWTASAAGTGADQTIIALPEPEPLDMNLRTALRRRRSSFGRFEARAPMSAAKLAALLAANANVRIDCDVTTRDTPQLTTMYVLVNHVEGVPAGAYEYHTERNELRCIQRGISEEFVDHNYYYFLANYNVEQAAAVIVPAMRTTAVLNAVGDRGYHLVNATMGAISQTCYVTSAALGVGCGVALGFDNISYTELLGLTGTDQAPLLLMMVGNERVHQANYRYEIV